MNKLFNITILIILLIGCTTKTPTADTILEEAIQAHGGWEAWQETLSISFEKTSILYFPDGSVESEVTQSQSFQWKPNFNGSIRWTSEDGDIHIKYDGINVHKTINDSVVTDQKELEAAKKSVLGAEYVAFLPFKLKDEKAQLTFVRETMFGNEEVYELSLTYKDQTERDDQWTLYFHKQNKTLYGYDVKHKNRISRIFMKGFDQSAGLRLDTKRESYFLDSLGNRDYLRARFYYRDFIRTVK